MARMEVYVAVASGKYSGFCYGPFVHWQAAADWVDTNLNGHTYVIYSGRVISDKNMEEINKRYS